MLIQFIAAFDDIVIGRYNKNREEKEQIKVRYIHAPKERVLFDIVNKAQNITLPVVSISVSQIGRDSTRVFNKSESVYGRSSLSGTNYYRMPVPVNVSVSMSILASYQSDIDQILSNFIPYSNPYVVISWKVPSGFNLPNIHEIRSEVTWDGSIALEYPVDSTPTDKPRFTATTSFVIKGWLFPEAPDDAYSNIYFIENNFHTINEIAASFAYTGALSTADVGITDTITLSATPEITNVYYMSAGAVIELFDTYQTPLTSSEVTLLLLGKNFLDTEYVILSSNTLSTIPGLSSVSLDFEYYDTINGFVLNPVNYSILDGNTMHVKLPMLSGDSGNFNILVTNVVGYGNTLQEVILSK